LSVNSDTSPITRRSCCNCHTTQTPNNNHQHNANTAGCVISGRLGIPCTTIVTVSSLCRCMQPYAQKQTQQNTYTDIAWLSTACFSFAQPPSISISILPLVVSKKNGCHMCGAIWQMLVCGDMFDTWKTCYHRTILASYYCIGLSGIEFCEQRVRINQL